MALPTFKTPSHFQVNQYISEMLGPMTPEKFKEILFIPSETLVFNYKWYVNGNDQPTLGLQLADSFNPDLVPDFLKPGCVIAALVWYQGQGPQLENASDPDYRRHCGVLVCDNDSNTRYYLDHNPLPEMVNAIRGFLRQYLPCGPPLCVHRGYEDRRHCMMPFPGASIILNVITAYNVLQDVLFGSPPRTHYDPVRKIFPTASVIIEADHRHRLNWIDWQNSPLTMEEYLNQRIKYRRSSSRNLHTAKGRAHASETRERFPLLYFTQESDRPRPAYIPKRRHEEELDVFLDKPASILWIESRRNPDIRPHIRGVRRLPQVQQPPLGQGDNLDEVIAANEGDDDDSGVSDVDDDCSQATIPIERDDAEDLGVGMR